MFPNPLQTNSDDEAQARERARQENVRREMERVSNDLILVNNPTQVSLKHNGRNYTISLKEDYKLDWDGFKHVIQSGSSKNWRRFLAAKYCREMKDLIINKLANIIFNEMMADRDKRGLPTLTPYERQELWAKTATTEDPALMAQIYPLLWGGIVEEYGKDAQPDHSQYNPDYKTNEEKILESLGNKRAVTKETADLEPLHDVDQAKKEALKGVSQ